MNGTYYKNPTFLGDENETVENVESELTNDVVENKSMVVNVFASFPQSMIVRDKKFHGELREVNDDYIDILNDKTTYVIPIKYINYIECEGENIYK